MEPNFTYGPENTIYCRLERQPFSSFAFGSYGSVEVASTVWCPTGTAMYLCSPPITNSTGLPSIWRCAGRIFRTPLSSAREIHKVPSAEKDCCEQSTSAKPITETATARAMVGAGIYLVNTR